MIALVGRMILKRLLGSPDVRKKIFDALDAEAKKTETKIDDDAVAVFKTVYDVAMPIIVGQIN